MRSRAALGAALGVGASVAAVSLRKQRAQHRPGFAYLAGAPLLIAHRGGADLAPENTLVAFRRAVEWWNADILELDVHPTRDGEVAVIHDDTVDRTTDGTGPITSFTTKELRQLDAGYRFTPDGGASFPFRGRGVEIPTLREVLEALPDARVNVEIKDGRAQPGVWNTIHDLGAMQRVLVASGRRRNKARFRRYAGPRSAAREDIVAFLTLHRLHAAALFAPTIDAFQIPERSRGRQVLSPRFVRELQAKNVPVHIWTVNAEADMRRLLDWGVDGIITDRPDRLARVLNDVVGRPLPPGPPAGVAEPFMERLLRG